MNTLVWFRRDLRTTDHTALSVAVQKGKNILPFFVVDKSLAKDGDSRLDYLYQALRRLDTELQKKQSRLSCGYGDPLEIIPEICEKYQISTIIFAKAISTYGQERDKKIKKLLSEKGIEIIEVEDTLLVPVETVPVRKVYSAFYRLWEKETKKIPLKEIESFKSVDTQEKTIGEVFTMIDLPQSSWNLEENLEYFWKGDFSQYEESRNMLAEEGTTKLSPLLRFGIISVREVFSHLCSCTYETIILQKEIAWREFWVHISYNFPETREQEFQKKRRHIQWKKDEAMLEKWKNGETGYPIIDAAMRQLNTENWMHNRARMIVASFLTKDLQLDWREGEKYFAQKLLDYDEAVNIGNWQWSASVGADPKPMRIFSPILQAERFDPEGKYITKYIPELKGTRLETLQNPLKHTVTDYPRPIVDHREVIAETKKMYRGEVSLF